MWRGQGLHGNVVVTPMGEHTRQGGEEHPQHGAENKVEVVEHPQNGGAHTAVFFVVLWVSHNESIMFCTPSATDNKGIYHVGELCLLIISICIDINGIRLLVFFHKGQKLEFTNQLAVDEFLGFWWWDEPIERNCLVAAKRFISETNGHATGDDGVGDDSEGAGPGVGWFTYLECSLQAMSVFSTTFHTKIPIGKVVVRSQEGMPLSILTIFRTYIFRTQVVLLTIVLILCACGISLVIFFINIFYSRLLII
ncbi:hypothetical protein P691DRAFT_786720 [Macrolepiota fuliginosa MF-IS2]|uniref:Uncharacterized protein n=1 Tax=Macrolepiota fuliginosa MF-IS2 TaxID=1400762 RepID=A0A9P5X4P6_9AGAR|nr:hypothetical protein P691DRAFT_786720 [Macrolepiota fuliginosa MF-IS2]